MSVGVLERVEELDRRGARVLEVLLHAAAGIEQQPEVQRRRRVGIAGGEVLIDCVLPFSKISKSSAVRPVIGRPCLSVTDDAEVHEIDGRRKVCCAVTPIVNASPPWQ